MDSVYTTTITDEARRRGICVDVLDPSLPVFELVRGRKRVRCYNALTDRVGAATFFLAQNKGAANHFLRAKGFPVPAQEAYRDADQAARFLARWRRIVVKPAAQWGGRGVSMDVQTPVELKMAVARARRYEPDVVLEQQVEGVDQRLILVEGRFVAAIERTPARVTGNGRDNLRALIHARNRESTRIDPSHRIPLDAETRRCLAAGGRSLSTVPARRCVVAVRRNANYHTGGDVRIVTGEVSREVIRMARQIARTFGLPVVGIDFLVARRSRRAYVIEISPDLAISPPEGFLVVRAFMDMLFPETRECARSSRIRSRPPERIRPATGRDKR